MNSYPSHIIISQSQFMIMSRLYGYTFEEALEAWTEKSGGRAAISVDLEEFNRIGTDKCTLYEQKHPVSDEQRRKWIEEAWEKINDRS